MHDRLQVLRDMGADIDNSELPFTEKVRITETLSHTVHAINEWLAKNRHLAEAELQNRYLTDNFE